MSRIVRFHEFGDPVVLKIEENSVPPLMAGDVLVSVDAIGVSWFDVLWRQNLAPSSANLPAGLGYELAGVIQAVGPGVEQFKVGDKVASFPAHDINKYACYAEHVVLPANSLTSYPHNLTAKQAAVHYFPAMIAWLGLTELAEVQPGESVMVTAASRGWGPYIVQMVKALGCTAIAATTSSADKEWLKALGADHVVVTDEEDLVCRIQKLTSGQGVNVIMDALGGPQMRLLGDAIAVGGRLVLFDLYGGNETALPACAAFKKNIRFFIHCIGSFTGSQELNIPQNREVVAKALDEINNLTAEGLLKPNIDREFDFEDVVAAHRHMGTCPNRGRVVLNVK